MNKPNEITLEELKSEWKGFLTVGQLRKALEKYSDESKVLVQRIEDQYYEGVDISGMVGILPDGSSGTLPEGTKAEGWRVVLKKSDAYYHATDWNEMILRRDFDEEQDNPSDKSKLYTEEEIESMMEQYSPVWSIVDYEDDPDNLYLNLHY